MRRTLPPQLEEFVRKALDMNATDLFLLPDEPPTMRVHGSIARTDAEVLSAEEIEALAKSALGENAMEKIGNNVGEIHRSFSLPGEAHMVLCVARASGDYTISATLSRAWLSTTETGIPEAMLKARSVVNQVYLDDKIKQYIIDIVFATREPQQAELEGLESMIEYGASPRASIYLHRAARAHAFLKRRGYVTPEDVKAIGMDILRHRVIPTYEAEAEELTSEDIVKQIFDTIEVP